MDVDLASRAMQRRGLIEESTADEAVESKTSAELRELSRRGSVSGASSSLRSALERLFSSHPTPPAGVQAAEAPSRPPPPPPAPPPPPPPLRSHQPSAQEVHTPAQMGRTEGPRGRRPRGRRSGGADGRDGRMDLRWLGQPWVLAALSLAVLLAVASSSWAATAAAQVPGLDVNMLLRTNSEVFSTALQEATARADGAVAERERMTAQLKTCQRDLQAREDYLKAAAPEVQKLREELREAQFALTRIEAYFGAAAMAEAQRHRGWLQRALAMGSDGGAYLMQRQTGSASGSGGVASRAL